MKNRNRWIIVLVIACLSVSTVYAQKADSLFRQFERRFELLDSIINHPERHSANAGAALSDNKIVADHYDRRVVDSVIDNKVDARISEMKNVTGLTVNGQVYGRLDEGFGLDEEDALSRYKGKIQAEIRWNFLKSSIINRKGKANEIRLQGDIQRLEYKRENIGRWVALQKELFRNRYDSLLCGVLTHRIENLTLLSTTQSFLLMQGGISSDDLLNILNEKAEAERLMATIIRDYPASSDLSNPSGIIVDIDSTRLISFICEYNTGTSTVELRRRLLDQQISNTSYWTTLNLSPFIRYSYYMRPKIPNSSNVDAGASFIIPLTLETAKKRKAMKAERAVIDLERDRLIREITENVRVALLDIERMNRSIEGEVKRLSELKGYLSVRREAYDNRIGEYNYLLRMKEYNTYLLCCERLLSFSYQRDCMLASLQVYLPDVSILDFCVETQLKADRVKPLQ
ncbi:hypothetical protein AB9N12_18990 [Bacteroides sp. AN502(2024)]|uniref:hypothetical protein n=1 Tax=Bacteroides sp. AN502(2024) TaxID=3160599 RepID=UPI003513C9FF